MGVVSDEFNFLIADEIECETTFEDDSKEYVEQANRFLEQAKQYADRTIQGIPASSIAECISICKTDIMPWEHTVFTIDVNKLKNIGNIRLSELKIPAFIEEVQSIGDKAETEFGFNQSHRNYLKTIYIPKSVAVIADNTFAFYKNLENVIFEDESKLIYIGEQAFACCEKLHSIDFRKCKELDSIHCNVFSGTHIETLKLAKVLENLDNIADIKTLYIGNNKYNIINLIGEQNGK